MNPSQKRSYRDEIRKRYKKSSRKKKAAILNEFCEICGYNRKYAIRILNHKSKKQRTKSGRKPRYDANAILPHLKAIWLACDQMCSKRLKAALPSWLPHYESEQGELDEVLRGQIYSLSPATLDRLLKPLRVDYPTKGRSGTKPGRLLKNQIPIKTDNWDVTQPGFLEADTVAHGGNSVAGNFAWSLTLSDILSGWTENRATWNKGAAGVVKQIKNIEKNLPFSILGFDCDNGSEFLNHHLIRYFTNRKKPVQFTRSRPYHKNDNAHVEQKNWTHVRHLFGYDRFDKFEVVSLMNDLYQTEWSQYQNYFCPMMKLIEKTKINSKYHKKYDKPKTAYQRLLDSSAIAESTKAQLRLNYAKLNPFELKRSIERKLKRIFKLINITTSVRKRL